MIVTVDRRVLFLRFIFFRAVFEADFVMDTYNLKTFVKEPTLRVVNVLKKSQLLEVANYYKLEVDNSQKKSEIKQLLIDHLIDEEIIPEDDVEQTSANVRREHARTSASRDAGQRKGERVPTKAEGVRDSRERTSDASEAQRA